MRRRSLILICACEVWRWGEIAGQFDSPIIIGCLIIIIIIIIVLYINRRMSLISSWLSTKTFAIVNISDYHRYTILSSIGTTLMYIYIGVERLIISSVRFVSRLCGHGFRFDRYTLLMFFFVEEWMKHICPCFTPSRIALAEGARETISLRSMLSTRFFFLNKRLYDIHVTRFLHRERDSAPH